MSRVPTLLLGSVLLAAVVWTAVAVDNIPLALVINGNIAELLGEKPAATDYAAAIFTVLCLLVTALIGTGIGWSLRATTAHEREAELQRNLNDTKGRIPRLESGMRNKEMQVARIEQQMKDLEAQLPPLHRTIEERDIAMRDRDRTITLLKNELALLKGTPLAVEAASSAMAALDLEDDTFTMPSRSAYPSSPQPDERTEVLEERVRELEAKVREREARIAELMYEQGTQAKRIPQPESELGDQRKRNEDFDRERSHARTSGWTC